MGHPVARVIDDSGRLGVRGRSLRQPPQAFEDRGARRAFIVQHPEVVLIRWIAAALGIHEDRPDRPDVLYRLGERPPSGRGDVADADEQRMAMREWGDHRPSPFGLDTTRLSPVLMATPPLPTLR